MKGILILVAALAALAMTGCEASGNISEFGIDVSDIRTLERAYGGGVEVITLSDNDKSALSEWLGGLKFKHRTYPVGETPGDSDGGEAYCFTFSDGELSYINNGMNDRFLLFDSEWYELIDPEGFPINS